MLHSKFCRISHSLQWKHICTSDHKQQWQQKCHQQSDTSQMNFYRIEFLTHAKWYFSSKALGQKELKTFQTLCEREKNTKRTKKHTAQEPFSLTLTHSRHVCKSFTLKDSIYWFEFFFDELFVWKKKVRRRGWKNQQHHQQQQQQKFIHSRVLILFFCVRQVFTNIRRTKSHTQT